MGLVFCLGSGLAVSQQTEDLRTLDFGTLQQRASAGEAAAQAELGSRYRRAQGGAPADNALGLAWVRKAADQGDVKAELELASNTGDYTQDAVWYRKAADQGDATAEYYLGFAYRHGQGVCQDDVQAVFWYRKAAEQGNAAAKAELVKLNPPDATVAPMPQTGGACTLDRTTQLQRSVRGDVSVRPQLDADYAKSVAELKEKAAHGDADAQCELGGMLSEGSFGSVPPDITQAVAWWRTGAAHGNHGCEFDLGWAYESGSGVPQNLSQALLWYRKARSDDDVERLTAQHPELVSAAATVGASSGPSTSGANPESQEIADKIEELQSDIEQHETAAERWSNSAQNLANSGCSGVGAALCESIGQAGVAEAQANRNGEINAANEDRAEIRRLQGLAARSRPPLDASFSGNLQQVTSEAAAGAAGVPASPQSLAIQRQLGTRPQMDQELIHAAPGKGCWNGKSGAASGSIPGSESWSACPAY